MSASLHPSPQFKVHSFEQSFLRHSWWFFSVLGIASMLFFSLYFWSFIDLTPLPGFNISHAAKVPYVLLAISFACFPLIWWLGIKCTALFNPHVSRLPWAVIWAGLVLIFTDQLIQTTRFQSPFWLAVRARAAPDDFFMRELAYIRLEVADSGLSGATNAVVLMGSSQVLHGIDDRQLASIIHPVQVKRRAMFGLTPLKALAAEYYLSIVPSNTVLWYLSEFDFTNQDPFPTDWMRPLIRRKGWGDIFHCFSWRDRIKRWRQWVDLSMSVIFEFWRMRDYVQHVLMHLASVQVQLTDSARQKDVVKSLIPHNYQQVVRALEEEKAFTRLMDNMHKEEASVVIFEGQLNPDMDTRKRLEERYRISQWLQAASLQGYYRFVPLHEQPNRFGSEAWKDMTHLNVEGRMQFTQYVGEYLNHSWHIEKKHHIDITDGVH